MTPHNTGETRRTFLKGTAASITAGGALLSGTGTAAAADTIYTNDAFVRTSGTDFTLEGSTWRWSGTNNFWLTGDSGYTRSDFDAFFQLCNDHNVDVVRTWAFQDLLSDDTWYDGDGCTWEPGGDSYGMSHSSEGFKQLDKVVASAADHGVRLILSLENYWRAFGGMPQWIRWFYEDYLSDGDWRIPDDYEPWDTSTVWFSYNSSTDTTYFDWSREAFFRFDELRTRYKDFVNTVLWHSNGERGGTPYKEDPAIMLWELANEPHIDYSAFVDDRGDHDGDGQKGERREYQFDDWIAEMAPHLKSIDSNHLLSTGHEGYYTYKGSAGWEYNGNEWLYNGVKGADFENNHDHAAIDAATYHMYPNNWGFASDNSDGGKNFGTNWIAEHKADADDLGIPVYAGEFGWQLDSPDPYDIRTDIYDTWYQELDTGGTAGALIWQFQNHPNFNGDGYRFDEGWRAADQMQKYGASVHDPGSTYEDWTWW